MLVSRKIDSVEVGAEVEAVDLDLHLVVCSESHQRFALSNRWSEGRPDCFEGARKAFGRVACGVMRNRIMQTGCATRDEGMLSGYLDRKVPSVLLRQVVSSGAQYIVAAFVQLQRPRISIWFQGLAWDGAEEPRPT